MRLAAATGAYICFEDEAGQAMRPPKARTRARRGCTPVAMVSGKGSRRVSMAGMTCYRPGARSRFFYRTRVHADRKGERRSMSEADYAALVTAAHQQLHAPLILVWGNLNTHISTVMRTLLEQRHVHRSGHLGIGARDGGRPDEPMYPTGRPLMTRSRCRVQDMNSTVVDLKVGMITSIPQHPSIIGCPRPDVSCLRGHRPVQRTPRTSQAELSSGTNPCGSVPTTYAQNDGQMTVGRSWKVPGWASNHALTW